PIEQTLRYGIEMADALDKAHRQGIVHRDLKPGNVMLTKSGVKLVDFGLAKFATVGPASVFSSATAMPTKAPNLTAEGTILGTFQYMAPEQLEGREADARTDIFALGSVLYEMATGEKAFSGSSQASLIGAILKDEPKTISTIQPMAPPALNRVVKTCLAKDPDDRWQTAHDVMLQLKWIAEGADIATAPAAPRRNLERLVWAALVLLVALAGVTAVTRSRRQLAALARPLRSSIVLPEKTALRSLALSPDGRRLVVVARDSSGRNLLWIRPLDTLSLQALPGTENPSFPFWSPDSRFIAFFADGKLKKIDASSGPAQTICDAPINRGGSWSRDGVILFTPVPDGPLYRVSASGGRPEQVTRFDPARGETSHRWPLFLPDGRRFLYLITSFGSAEEPERMGVYAGSLDSKEEKFLVTTKSKLAYAPPGYLLFLREKNLLAQPFDAKSLQIIGDPFPLAEQIQYFPQTANALYSVSESGLLVYQGESPSALSQMVWLDRGGREVGTLGAPSDQANPRISPDGTRVALDIMDHQTGNMDLWIYPSSGGVATRITSDAAIDAVPLWSPDGNRLAFMSIRGGHPDVYQRSSGGEGTEDVLVKSERAKYTSDWSPDGKNLLYRVVDATSNLELWSVPIGGAGKPAPFLKSPFGVSHGQFSPDGRWVAYASNESGRWEIFVAPFPGPGGNWRVTSAGGTEPRWRRDGKELFYLAPDGKLMAVAVKPGPSFEAGIPTVLFQTRRRVPVSATDLYSYDASPDGQRFLVSTDVGEGTSSALTLVLHWTADLKH
ncbi:MAG: protein kinase, partial [Thermoanaerobaculia bacterium]